MNDRRHSDARRWALRSAAWVALLLLAAGPARARDLDLDETDPATAAASEIDLLETVERAAAPAAEIAPRLLPAAGPFEPLGGGGAKGAPNSESGARPSARDPSGADPARKDFAGAEKSEPSAPVEQRVPNSPPGAPQSLVRLAFELSKSARTEREYSEIITYCRRGIDGGLQGAMLPYASQLMGWAHNRRGELRADADRNDDAQEDFEAAVRLDGTKWRHYHNRGVGYAALGKYDEALADFNRTIKLHPRYANAYFNRGEMRYEKQDFPAALDDYNVAIRLSPQDAAAFNSRGHTYYRLERFREALADYNEAVRLDPQSAAACTNRGDAFADLGQYADAAHDYQTAIRLNPRLGRAYQSAAWLMATCPDETYRSDELAISAARKAIELDGPADHRFLETLAAAQASAGDFAAAVATQQQAMPMVPDDLRARADTRLKLYERHSFYREMPRELPEPSTMRQAARPTFHSPPTR